MVYLTAELPGIGGQYKETPEDFRVEELPLYPCSGSGEHGYLWIEKQGISTRDLIDQLCRGLRLKEQQIGYAGLKDARATTRQTISIPFEKTEQALRLQLKQARIIGSDRHNNKLRLGHLAGNRFNLILRGVHPEAEARARAILSQLEQRGVPNRFGEQRYGILGNSARLGLLLAREEFPEFCRELLGDPQQIRNDSWRNAALAFRENRLEDCLASLPQKMRDESRLVHSLRQGNSPRSAVLGLPRGLLRLFLSALQSQLFDQLLEERLGHIDRLEDGDIAFKHDNGACFRVVSARDEQPRADDFSISPTAPLFGHKVMGAEGLPGQRENLLLERSGLGRIGWKFGRGLNMPGERRPLRVPLQQSLARSLDAQTLELVFCLPKGSYATSVLLEIMKKELNSTGKIIN